MKVSEWEEGKKWLVAPRPNKKDKDKTKKYLDLVLIFIHFLIFLSICYAVLY